MPRAGDNIFLFESGSGSTSLPAGRKPRRHAVKETSRGSPATFRVPCPQTPTSSSSTADTARPTCAADGSAWGSALYGRRNVSSGGWRCVVRLWGRRRLRLRQLANGDPACGSTSDGGRAARRVALSAGIRWTTRAARTVREHRRVRSGSIQS